MLIADRYFYFGIKQTLFPFPQDIDARGTYCTAACCLQILSRCRRTCARPAPPPPHHKPKPLKDPHPLTLTSPPQPPA